MGLGVCWDSGAIQQLRSHSRMIVRAEERASARRVTSILEPLQVGVIVQSKLCTDLVQANDLRPSAFENRVREAAAWREREVGQTYT